MGKNVPVELMSYCFGRKKYAGPIMFWDLRQLCIISNPYLPEHLIKKTDDFTALTLSAKEPEGTVLLVGIISEETELSTRL